MVQGFGWSYASLTAIILRFNIFALSYSYHELMESAIFLFLFYIIFVFKSDLLPLFIHIATLTNRLSTFSFYIKVVYNHFVTVRWFLKRPYNVSNFNIPNG